MRGVAEQAQGPGRRTGHEDGTSGGDARGGFGGRFGTDAALVPVVALAAVMAWVTGMPLWLSVLVTAVAVLNLVAAVVRARRARRGPGV